jgi:plasmid maintenance system antidote protein VapI
MSAGQLWQILLFGSDGYFKTTPRFWLNLQIAYDLEVVEDQILARIENEVQPLGTASR